MHPETVMRQIKNGRGSASKIPVDSRALRAFTARQLQIARLIARGDANREIAGELGLSVFTVRNEVSSILRKLNVKKRSQIAFLVGQDDDPAG